MLSETWKRVIIYWKHYNLIYFTPPTTLVSFSNTAGWFSWDLIKLTPFGLSFVLQFFLGAILRSNNGTPQIIAKIAILCKSIFQRSCFLMPPLKSRVESQYLFYVLNMFNSSSLKIDLSNQKSVRNKVRNLKWSKCKSHQILFEEMRINFILFWGGFKSRMTQLPSLDPFIPSSVLSDHTAWKKNFEKNKIEKAFNPMMLECLAKRNLRKVQYSIKTQMLWT